METLTHWKKTVNPDYIGSYVLESDRDLILTIKSAGVEMVTGNGGKKEEKLVIHFMENVKPMICNRTNAKVISKLHKTPYIEQWKGKKIQLYSSRITAFGEEVDALRIRDFVKEEKPSIDVTAAIFRLEGCKTLNELKTTFLSLSKAEQSDSRVNEITEKLKKELK